MRFGWAYWTLAYETFASVIKPYLCHFPEVIGAVRKHEYVITAHVLLMSANGPRWPVKSLYISSTLLRKPWFSGGDLPEIRQNSHKDNSTINTHT